MIVAFQIITIIVSRGDVTYLADLYAFGVIWSFAMNGVVGAGAAFTRTRDEREYRVPLNLKIGQGISQWASR